MNIITNKLKFYGQSQLKELMNKLAMEDSEYRETFSSLIERIENKEEGKTYGSLCGFSYDYVDDFVRRYDSLISNFVDNDFIRLDIEKINKLYFELIDKLKNICEAFAANYFVNFFDINDIDLTKIDFVNDISKDEQKVIKEIFAIYIELKSQEIN